MSLVLDIRGRSFDFATPPRRVVSLVPSVTETLFDLGAGPSLVGITRYCIFPAEGVATIERVGGTKNPDIDAIRALSPDLVHMNLEENLRGHAEAIEAFAPVFVSEPKSVEDVVALIGTLGALHGRSESAVSWQEAITRETVRKPAVSFRFACAIWKDPWMWCGGDTYVSRLIRACGGENILEDLSRYPRVALDEIRSRQPSVIFLPDEPWAFTEAEADAVRESTGVRVVGPFPGHLATWHGTRTLAGLRYFLDLNIDAQA